MHTYQIPVTTFFIFFFIFYEKHKSMQYSTFSYDCSFVAAAAAKKNVICRLSVLATPKRKGILTFHFPQHPHIF